MKPVSYLVVYKDGRDERPKFFGPFVSNSIAQFFKAEMPDPEPGGYCRIAPIEPFTQQEGHIVRRKLLDARNVVA